METKNRSLNGKNIELNARFLSSHILNLNHIFLLKVVPANITNIQNLNMHSAGKFNAKSSSKIFQGHISEKSPPPVSYGSSKDTYRIFKNAGFP